MLKKITAPFQKILLEKRMCPGCTYPLDKIKERNSFTEKKDIMTCKCKRVFILDRETNTYRRATLEEEQIFLNNNNKQ